MRNLSKSVFISVLMALSGSNCIARDVKIDIFTSHLRGFNKLHWDQSNTGIKNTRANVVRFALNFTRPAKDNISMVQSATPHALPIVGNWEGTCKQDAKSLSSIVDTWLDQSKVWTKLDGTINIANEWGPGYLYQQQVSPWKKIPNHGWRDGYIAAIKRMRSAGYTNTLMIDAGACGQDWRAIVNDGAAVLASDPQHKIVFDLHIYGALNTDAKLDEAFSALAASKLPIFIGEFGPGRMIGPSPTPITPQNIIARAEKAHFGWAAWAWDDNNLNGCKSDDNWFSMTNSCSAYDGSPSQLTAFGKIIVPLLHSPKN